MDNSQFSEREKEVIGLLLQGRSNKQIALELHIAQSTVEYHLKNIYQKLEVSSRTEAVLRLGKSIGNDVSSELEESAVASASKGTGRDAKPIFKPKIPINKISKGIAVGLTAAALILIFYRYQSAQSPCAPQDFAMDPVAGTPTALVIPQTEGMAWEDQIVLVLDPADTDGNLAGIRGHMKYWKSLGITAVLLGPVFSDQDFTKVDSRLGTNDELVLLIDEFHSTDNGPRINVILNLAMASTGTGHEWFTHPQLYARYYRLWNTDNQADNVAAAPLSPEKPVDHWLGKPLLNHTRGIKMGTGVYAEVRDTIFWIADHFAFDGFQYATAHYYCAAFWPKYMSDFHDRYDKTKPDFWHIAEVLIWPPDQVPWQIPYSEFINQTSSAGPIAMDGAHDFPLQTFIQDVSSGGADPNCVSGFCVPIYNHLLQPDSVQNPERLAASVDQFHTPFLQVATGPNAKEQLYLAYALLLTINRVPLIDHGHEYGVDPTEPGPPFDGELDQTFHEKFLELIQVRRDNPAFRRGRLTRLETTANVISFARQYDGETFIVVLNLSANTTPDFQIALGTQGISCNRVTNLLLEEDRNLQLGSSGINNTLLTVTLEGWVPKILRCE